MTILLHFRHPCMSLALGESFRGPTIEPRMVPWGTTREIVENEEAIPCMNIIIMTSYMTAVCA